MTPSKIKNMLTPHSDVISCRKGIYTVKKCYFWGYPVIGEKLYKAVTSLIPNVIILEEGNHYVPFHGGAKIGSKRDSYFWIKFTIGK